MEYAGNQEIVRHQEMCETLLHRAEFLDPKDQALLKQSLERGANATEIAKLMGVPPRQIQRKLKRLMTHLIDPRVVQILRHHREWDKRTRGVALSYFVRGWTLREVADRLKMTLHEVRKRKIEIQAILDATLK